MREVLFFFLLFSLYGCNSNSNSSFQPFNQGAVLSIVNEDTVTAEFFNQAYIQHIINTGRNDTRSERYQFLNSIQNDLLLAQKADTYQLLDSTYSSYMKQIERISVADRFFSSSFLDSLSLPSEEQIQAAYFNTKIKMHVSHLFFTDQKKAEYAYNRLERGVTFLDLANEIYNISVYDSTAGYLGEISYFNVDDAFGEAAYSLKAGEYSKPVRTRQGIHIIYVNHRIGNPIITQSEFEYKKKGITGLTKQRIKTLKGDAFVQSYMQSLDIQIDRNAVEQLYQALREIRPRSNSDNSFLVSQEVTAYPSNDEVEFVRQLFNQNTILASYIHLRENKLFRAEDYFKWLKTIPLEEARSRTMASIGRALRNQVFYEAGSEKGIKNDPIVQFNIDYKDKFYKSYLAKKHLSDQPLGSIKEEEMRAAFYGFGMNRSKNRTFTGWIIKTDSFESAQSIKNEITLSEAIPSSFKSYEYFENADVRQAYELQNHILKAPLNAPVIANIKNNFYVLKISEQNIERVKFEEVQTQVVDRMSKYYNVLQELKKLHQNSEITVDTTAFEELMKHFEDPALRRRG